jgi:hypothetical protein
VTLVLTPQPTPITLSVGTGSVTLTWVRERVLYARLSGELSLRLGMAQAARLEEITRDCTGIHYFADGAALTHYDPRVRDLFATLIRSRPGRFASITLLACDLGVKNTAEPLVDSSHGLLRIRTQPAQFERELFAA